MGPPTLTATPRQLTAEAIGTAFLLTGVVGSGIMAERLTDDVGLQLLQNAIATGAVLVALILTFGPVSGAHFNPVVTLVDRALGKRDTRSTLFYVAAQTVGGITGVVITNAMFDLPLIDWSTKNRTAGNLVFSEVIATIGLLLVIYGMARSGKIDAVPYAVGAYITGAYYFTSSTSFANPAVTIARMFSDTFAGIGPAGVPAFIAAQLVAAAFAVALIRHLFPEESP